jgi:hypothetical protein
VFDSLIWWLFIVHTRRTSLSLSLSLHDSIHRYRFVPLQIASHTQINHVVGIKQVGIIFDQAFQSTRYHFYHRLLSFAAVAVVCCREKIDSSGDKAVGANWQHCSGYKDVVATFNKRRTRYVDMIHLVLGVLLLCHLHLTVDQLIHINNHMASLDIHQNEAW